jgi:hypothetical protein
MRLSRVPLTHAAEQRRWARRSARNGTGVSWSRPLELGAHVLLKTK